MRSVSTRQFGFKERPYDYLFYRIYKWYARREQMPTSSAMLFLSMLGVCNLWSLIILIDRRGVVVACLLKYKIGSSITLCPAQLGEVHSLVFLRNRRYRQIIETFETHKVFVTFQHKLIFWIYVIGTIPTLVIIIASTPLAMVAATSLRVTSPGLYLKIKLLLLRQAGARWVAAIT